MPDIRRSLWLTRFSILVRLRPGIFVANDIPGSTPRGLAEKTGYPGRASPGEGSADMGGRHDLRGGGRLSPAVVELAFRVGRAGR